MSKIPNLSRTKRPPEPPPATRPGLLALYRAAHEGRGYSGVLGPREHYDYLSALAAKGELVFPPLLHNVIERRKLWSAFAKRLHRDNAGHYTLKDPDTPVTLSGDHVNPVMYILYLHGRISYQDLIMTPPSGVIRYLEQREVMNPKLRLSGWKPKNPDNPELPPLTKVRRGPRVRDLYVTKKVEVRPPDEIVVNACGVSGCIHPKHQDLIALPSSGQYLFLDWFILNRIPTNYLGT